MTAFMLTFSVGVAHAGLVGQDATCMPHNQEWVVGYADMYGGGYSYKCSLTGKHGNYGTTAYTNVYYWNYQNVAEPCETVGAQVTYSYNGTLFTAARSDATLHNWATSAPSGSNRYIVGSTFFATRYGYYNYSTTMGAIGC